jgi:RND family efflux transporter MFP subunit
MKRDQILTTAIGLAILLGAVAFTAWPESTGSTAEVVDRSKIVRVAEVTSGAATDHIRLAGVTRAARRAELGFTLSARLDSRPVEVGDRVHAGQILAALDDRQVRLAARAAEAAAAELEIRLEQAERDLQRVRELVQARAATTEELERTAAATAALGAAHNASRAQLDETRRMIEESTLTAPFSGTVTRVGPEPGEWIPAGAMVVELAGDGAVEVVVEAPESVYRRLRVGSEVHVELPFVDGAATGRVSSVASAAAGSGRLFPVEVTLVPRDGVVAGLTADVVFDVPAHNELTLPLEAVINPGSSTPAVFRIDDNRAERIEIEPGRVRGDRIAVTARLDVNDLVAVAGHTALRDGDLVEVRR